MAGRRRGLPPRFVGDARFQFNAKTPRRLNPLRGMSLRPGRSLMPCSLSMARRGGEFCRRLIGNVRSAGRRQARLLFFGGLGCRGNSGTTGSIREWTASWGAGQGGGNASASSPGPACYRSDGFRLPAWVAGQIECVLVKYGITRRVNRRYLGVLALRDAPGNAEREDWPERYLIISSCPAQLAARPGKSPTSHRLHLVHAAGSLNTASTSRH
jgi:hypothetical protein